MLIEKGKRPAPQNLNADTQGSFNRIWWDRYTNRHHTGMAIYRYMTYAHAVAHTNYVLLDEDVTGRMYKDNDNTLAVTQEYYYRIASVDKSGNESELSNIASVIYTGLKTKDLSLNAITEIITKVGQFDQEWSDRDKHSSTEHLLTSADGAYIQFNQVNNPIMIRATGELSTKLHYVPDGSDGKMFGEAKLVLWHEFVGGEKRKLQTWDVKLKNIKKRTNVDIQKIDKVFKLNPRLYDSLRLYAVLTFNVCRGAGDGWTTVSCVINISATWNKR